MSHFGNLNPYQLHQKLINEYILKKPGDTKKLYQRDASNDKTDLDVIRENHRFLWDEGGSEVDSWEKQLAKRYYDKLFKEYCIADLSRYKENKIALRWRVDKEVVTGKGQFLCGNKYCNERNELKSWEVNFAYAEHGERKNALIKLRLCPECSEKLNYHSKKREVKRIKKKSKHKKRSSDDGGAASSSLATSDSAVPMEELQTTQEPDNCGHNDVAQKQLEQIFWAKSTNEEEKTREDEFDEYLADLLL